MRGITVAILVCAAASFAFDVASARTKALDELTALHSANYNGGLSRHDRDVAERIRATMAPRYTGTCAPPNPLAGELVGLPNDTDKKPLPSLAGVDADLVTLIEALDAPKQEVRDVAAYTIGLLGPSAKEARPALEKHLDAKEPHGGWYNFALGRVSCQGVVSPDFRKVLPASVLTPEAPWTEFRKRSTVLLPRLYLDKDYEYPPGMMSYAYSNYGFGFGGVPDEAVVLLAQILDNEQLSDRKHIEAAETLTGIRGRKCRSRARRPGTKSQCEESGAALLRRKCA